MSVVNENLIYVPDPESLPTSDSYYTPIRPSNGSTFSQGQSIYIDIPAMQNGYLDSSNSWLQFDVKFTLTGAVTPATTDYTLSSAGAEGLIASLYSWSSNNANLETITNYGELARMLSVVSQDQSVNNSIRTICAGIGQAATLNNNLVGETIYSDAATAKTLSFAIPLISSVFGTLSGGRYLPLSMLAGSTRLQLDLVASAVDAINSSIASSGTPALTTVSFEVSNVAYQAKIVRVTEASQQAIMANARQDETGIVSYSGVGWRNYPRSVNISVAGTETFLVPARFRSLNNIIWGIRNPRLNNYSGQDPSSTYNAVSSFQTRISGISYPSVAPNTRAAQAQYLMGCFHAISNTLADTIVDSTSYQTAGTEIAQNAVVSDSKKCYMGVSYESFNDSAGSVNGLDTSSDLVEVLLTKVATTNGSTNANLLFCCQYDVLYSIDMEGNLSVSF